LLIITALGVVIVALLGYVVSRIGLRPVGALSKQARRPEFMRNIGIKAFELPPGNLLPFQHAIKR
jgi:hypothetical protein